jgi:methylenetetrahydrofolate reductase (NADPH)
LELISRIRWVEFAMTAVKNLLETLYHEVIPMKGFEDKLEVLKAGDRVGITCSPKQGLQVTLDTVSQLSSRALILTPHIAARQVMNRQHLRDIVAQLSDSGITSIFVPGGDLYSPMGDYDSSAAVLRDLSEMDHPVTRIGVASYPEGHPAISDDILFEALEAKQGIATHMVTQMCFDMPVLLKWLGEMRDRGITTPVWIGLPGVMDRMKLFKTSLRIGVGQSAKYARKQKGLAGMLLRSPTYKPDSLLKELKSAIGDERMAIQGLYMFTFNQLDNTVQWSQEQLKRLG